MTAADLNPELRTLIDARLDAIDRILMRAEIAWSERQSIVGEVETQIYELLARRSEAPNAEDVTAVLESLDPPEAYVPEELRVEFAGSQEATISPRAGTNGWSQRVVRVISRFSRGALCVLALVVINGVLVLLAVVSEGLIPWAVTLGCLVWVNYEAVRRYRIWASMHRGNPVDAFRQRVGEWLLSKGSAQAS